METPFQSSRKQGHQAKSEQNAAFKRIKGGLPGWYRAQLDAKESQLGGWALKLLHGHGDVKVFEHVEEPTKVCTALAGCWVAHFEKIIQVVEDGLYTSLASHPFQHVCNGIEN